MARDLPAIKIVRTTPPNLGGGAAVEERLSVKPVAPGVWDEFLALQISPATRRSYAAGLRDFFRREFQASVSPETTLAFLQLPERSAIEPRSEGLRQRVVSPHQIRHSSITALLDLNGGDVRSAQAHSRHKNLSTLIRYDDGRQQLQGKAAKTLADAVSARDVD